MIVLIPLGIIFPKQYLHSFIQRRVDIFSLLYRDKLFRSLLSVECPLSAKGHSTHSLTLISRAHADSSHKDSYHDDFKRCILYINMPLSYHILYNISNHISSYIVCKNISLFTLIVLLFLAHSYHSDFKGCVIYHIISCHISYTIS